MAVGMLTNAPRGAILTSADGTAWQSPSPSFVTSGPLTDVAFAGGKFITVGDSDLLSWESIGRLTNVTGSNIFTDPSATHKRRFYRAHQLP